MRPWLRSLLRALLACAALPLAACEHGIALQGKVSVPGPIKQMFSPQHPGELVVRAQIPGQPEINFPSVILCGAPGDEQIIDVRYVKLACAREDTALFSAWVIPRLPHEVSCTSAPSPQRSPDTQPTVDAVAFGRAVAPVHVGYETPTACKDGSISFDLTLAPRR